MFINKHQVVLILTQLKLIRLTLKISIRRFLMRLSPKAMEQNSSDRYFQFHRLKKTKDSRLYLRFKIPEIFTTTLSPHKMVRTFSDFFSRFDDFTSNFNFIWFSGISLAFLIQNKIRVIYFISKYI